MPLDKSNRLPFTLSVPNRTSQSPPNESPLLAGRETGIPFPLKIQQDQNGLVFMRSKVRQVLGRMRHQGAIFPPAEGRRPFSQPYELSIQGQERPGIAGLVLNVHHRVVRVDRQPRVRSRNPAWREPLHCIGVRAGSRPLSTGQYFLPRGS